MSPLIRILASLSFAGICLLPITPCFSQSPFVTPVSAVSRLTHGANHFDVSLPLTGPLGIECRNGSPAGTYHILLTFPHAITIGSAAVTSGTGSVSNASATGSQVTVDLLGVSNLQTITVTVSGVTDGTYTSDVSVSMRI